MNYLELSNWVNNLESESNLVKDIKDEVKKLKLLLKNQYNSKTLAAIKLSLETLVALKVTYKYNGSTAGTIHEQLQKKSTIEIIQKSWPEPFEKQIKNIFKAAYELPKELSTLDSPKLHELFIEHWILSLEKDREKFPPLSVQSLNTLEARRYYQAFINYHSGLHGKDLKTPTLSSTEIIEYSISLKKHSTDYANKVQLFQSHHRDHIIKNNPQKALDVLSTIKTLIEGTDWKLGRWGSKSQIVVAGETRKVPNHIHKIHQKIVRAIKNPAEAVKAISDINDLVTKALSSKPSFFKKLRTRDENTNKAYIAIQKNTNDFKK